VSDHFWLGKLVKQAEAKASAPRNQQSLKSF